MKPQRARRAGAGGERLHRDVAEGAHGRERRAAREPQGARPLHGGIPRPRRPSSSTSRWSWRRPTTTRTERVSIMTLHGAKGLEFDTVFLPGWEEGLFPNQRALDESGQAGLEEERRLAYVGLTRARRRAKIYFASNRRIHGLWQSTIPSRFVDELPEAHVEVTEAPAQLSAAMAAAASTACTPFGSTYDTPGWQRAQERRRRGGGAGGGGVRAAAVPASVARPTAHDAGPGAGRKGPLLIEGELVAKSTGAASAFAAGPARLPHQVRQRHRRRCRRQQADDRFRQGRPQDGAGQLREGGLSRKHGKKTARHQAALPTSCRGGSIAITSTASRKSPWSSGSLRNAARSRGGETGKPLSCIASNHPVSASEALPKRSSSSSAAEKHPGASGKKTPYALSGSFETMAIYGFTSMPS